MAWNCLHIGIQVHPSKAYRIQQLKKSKKKENQTSYAMDIRMLTEYVRRLLTIQIVKFPFHFPKEK